MVDDDYSSYSFVHQGIFWQDFSSGYSIPKSTECLSIIGEITSVYTVEVNSQTPA